MAQTDTRTGFRLPWTAERGEGEPPADGDGSDTQETETPDMIDTTQTSIAEPPPPPPAAVAPRSAFDALAAGAGAATPGIQVHGRPESGDADRGGDRPRRTMLRFEAETKSAIEEIQSASGDEAAALRRRADDDVAAVREWSKTEIAHIREETEQRIAQRKAALDGEMEAHAAVVETRIERVGTTVTAFQAEMEDFFQRLLAEEDPTRIATMAETMPEPPSLVAIAAAITEADPVPLIVVESREEAPVEAPADEPVVEATAEASTETEVAAEATVETEVAAGRRRGRGRSPGRRLRGRRGRGRRVHRRGRRGSGRGARPGRDATRIGPGRHRCRGDALERRPDHDPRRRARARQRREHRLLQA